MHMKSPRILRIKSMNNDRSDKYCVQIKLRRDMMSQNSDLYENKMALFDNGDPEEFLLFIRNFNMFLKKSGKLTARANIQYLCTLVCGKALRQFDTFSDEVGSTTPENLTSIILVFGGVHPKMSPTTSFSGMY